MPKVLIITYYWPPSGGSAVLRWVKFTKYLREFGWEPVIYTPANPEPQELDESLIKDIPDGLEVIKTKIREPYRIYKWITGRKQGDRLGVALISDKKRSGLFSKIPLWIRSNLFIPDPRMLWIRPSVKYLRKYIPEHSIDATITSGPPHSMHMIGLGLKKRTGVKWIADFRDPWTNIDFYRDLPLTRLADHYHKRLEKRILQEADHIITVSPGMTRDFISMGIKNITTITNGYDEEPRINPGNQDDKFRLLHLGSMPKSRNPVILWQVLSGIVKNNDRFASQLEIRLIGNVDISVLESLENHGLRKYVVQQSYIPHDQTLGILMNASVLLLCINDTPNAGGILTNKFFEYLSAQRPIVAVGPADGDASAILGETGAGKIFGYGDSVGLKGHVITLFGLYSQQDLKVQNQHIEKYSRKNLTRELTELLTRVIA